MPTPLPASSHHRDATQVASLPKSLFSVRVGPRENHMPEARNLSFGLVRPGKVAIVTIKSFRKNLKSKENARDRRGEKFRVICGYSILEDSHCGQRSAAPTSGSETSH